MARVPPDWTLGESTTLLVNQSVVQSASTVSLSAFDGCRRVYTSTTNITNANYHHRSPSRS